MVRISSENGARATRSYASIRKRSIESGEVERSSWKTTWRRDQTCPPQLRPSDFGRPFYHFLSGLSVVDRPLFPSLFSPSLSPLRSEQLVRPLVRPPPSLHRPWDVRGAAPRSHFDYFIGDFEPNFERLACNFSSRKNHDKAKQGRRNKCPKRPSQVDLRPY